jgi:hypothetical protein
MADYYPLIARAVAGLDRNTGEARRTLYERARAALVAQLRGVTPALSESDVTRERLALEEAIRKVEAESARQTASRIDTAVKVKAPEFPRWQEPEPEPPPPPRLPRGKPPRPDGRAAAAAPAASARTRAEPRHVEPDDEMLAPPDLVAPEPPPRRREAAARQDGRALASARAKPEARHADPHEDGAEPAPPRANSRARAERAPPERRIPPNAGLREILSEADELGGATARAKRSARESFAAVPAPPPDRPRAQSRMPDEDEAFLELEDVDEPVMLEPSFIVDESRPVPPRARQAPPPPRPIDPDAPPPRSLADIIRFGSAAVLLVAVVLLVAWQFPNMYALYRSLWTPSSDVVKDEPPPPAPATIQKLPDRLAPGGAPPQPSELASVAQRVVLYEEDPANPQGRRSDGSAVWRTEAVSPGPGKPPELAVHADIEIPERKISVTWSLRRDIDPKSTTSHTIEVMIKVPPDFPSGDVSNIPGIWMKQAEQTQGTALSGFVAKVTPGFFLIGLDATARDRNVQLLKDSPWLEMPIVYANSRRAILAIEKGTPGDDAFKQAFASWEK